MWWYREFLYITLEFIFFKRIATNINKKPLWKCLKLIINTFLKIAMIILILIYLKIKENYSISLKNKWISDKIFINNILFLKLSILDNNINYLIFISTINFKRYKIELK